MRRCCAVVPRLWLLACLLLVCSGAAWAQEDDTDALLDKAQAQLDDSQKVLKQAEGALDKANDEQLQQLAESVLDTQRQAQDLGRTLEPVFQQVDQRLKPLGEEQSSDPPDLRSQRRALQRERDALDAEVKRANLMAQNAADLSDRLERARARRFSERLSTRAPSPLSPALWSALAQQWPDDQERLLGLSAQGAQALQTARSAGVEVLIGVAIALVLAFPLRIFLRHLGRRYAASRAPGGRLRRSGLALWFLLVGTLTLGLAAAVLAESLRAAGELPKPVDDV
uniref:DUF3772 domain-containing protein n=1 Tax=Xanthomonas maliensis TaxID=1321368 RepID=UPI0004CFD58A